MSNINILSPIIQELEELARTHPDPEVRANIFHIIDVLVSSEEDSDILSTMHQYYHLREQLREEEELRKLRASEPEIPQVAVAPPESQTFHIGSDPSTEDMFFEMFECAVEEDEYDELVTAQIKWGIPIGEA